MCLKFHTSVQTDNFKSWNHMYILKLIHKNYITNISLIDFHDVIDDFSDIKAKKVKY